MWSDLKYRILIVDKDEESKNMLRDLLQKEGYEIEIASTAEKGMSLIRKKHFDLVLSDIPLGKMSGMELLSEVRKIYPSLPFIIISSHTSVENSLQAINLGVTSYLMKPIEKDMTLDVIKRSIRHHKSKFVKNDTVDYRMENTFYAVVSSNEQAILKLLDTVDNLIELVYPKEYGTFPELKMAIYEGLSNAIEHGNANLKEKNTYFTIELKMDRIIVHIKDEGPGFEYKKVFRDKAYNQSINHGLLLIHHLMDEVSFNIKGNEISMLKILS